MPELPEVETVKQTLQAKLVGLSFKGVRIFLPKVVQTPAAEQVEEMIAGTKILKIGRRGKYLLIHLDKALTLVTHLRMTGRLLYCAAGEPTEKYTHVIFYLDNGDELRFADMRQFGRLWVVPESSLGELPALKKLGMEPLEDGFTGEFLKKATKRRNTRIKLLLLDQSFIAGLGNIYTDEALYRAGINPERPAKTLTPREANRLYRAIRTVLQEGIKHRGTTISDFVDGNGRAGNYQELLKVYKKAGRPCPGCGKPIERKKVGGRSSYYCPRCQRL
ncbi:MAG: bifunctional DNA-formamidopyrimidine glycosylase/DNA-(apurinic or apyrimidinic site) lyase [Peptococcaceae bacterium]|nr:MAG: bifunctional DNA-formamidopyrimidine glycosylase/DNA-(apurinic or apyrimidinic site) lyase [Peptococcaceae bacterium]